MLKNLHNYLKNIKDPNSNFDLGLEYESMGQISSALGMYLRTANITDDNELAYTCLLKMASIFIKLENRPFSTETTFQQAVALLPKRPEAYFLLSQFQERIGKNLESYLTASVGLEVCDFVSTPLPADVGYVGKWGIIFEKAVTSWHCGKEDQARMLFQKLIDEHWNQMDDVHRSSVENNAIRLGCLPVDKTHKHYNKKHHSRLKFQFPGSDKIEKNFAQVYQDLFVLFLLKGKKEGCFLEVGGAKPFEGNNSALLETEFGWSGVSIEYDQNFANSYAAERKKTSVLCTDALKINYDELIRGYYASPIIDYLQLDIEPAGSTYEALLKIPFDKYKFAVITYEHDYYADMTRSYREKSRKYLQDMGYELVIGNVSPIENCSFEDWWVHPDLVDRDLIDRIKNVSSDHVLIEDHFFGIDTKPKTHHKEISVSKELVTAVNSDYRNGLWVVDNFYKNPDLVRELALKQEFDQGGIGRYYIGNRTINQFLFPGLKESFEKIMGRKITKWNEHGMNGRFQYCIEGSPLVYHCDDQKWAGMLYLTPDAPYETGTRTHALKGTDIRHNSHPDIMKCFRPGSQNLDITPFETVDTVGNVYNRLVIFNAGYIHSACNYFGWTKENSRLWQMFFFDTE